MPTPPIPQKELDRTVVAYEAAVRKGAVPIGQHVGAGKRSALWVAARALGKDHQWVRRNLQRARPDLFFSPDDYRQEIPADIEARLASERGDGFSPELPEEAVPPPGFTISGSTAVFDAEGNLRSQWVKTVKEPGVDYEMPPGHVIKGESALVDQTGRVLAKWIKTRESGTAFMVEAFEEVFRKYEGLAPRIRSAKPSTSDMLTVYPVPDLHFGMLSWGVETGADYDIDIAAKDAITAQGSLVAQSFGTEEATIIFLGDYFHQNDSTASTPRSKNILDVDGRWQKVFRAGAELAVRLVEQVAAKHKQVEVVVLPGNHDPDAAICLSVALGMMFKREPRIKINGQAGLIWYRRFHDVLLGATHGHTMKPADMAMALAADRPEDWGASRHRSFFFGHVHHETAKEVGGVRVESFSAAAARDAYAHNSGYRPGRALSALTFHKNMGEIGRHRVTITGQVQRVA